MAINKKLKRQLEIEGVNLKKRFKKPKSFNYPMSIERNYTRETFKLERELKKNIKIYLFAALQNIIASYKRTLDTVQLDGYVEELDETMNLIKIQTENSAQFVGFPAVAAKVGADISTYSLKEHTKVVKSVLGVSPFSSEPWIDVKQSEFTAKNVRLIKELNDEVIKDVQNIVENGVKAGIRQADIEKEIIRKIGLDTLKPSNFKMSAKNRAKLIARDQVSKFYGELTKLRQQNIGVETYYWRTANDERVRKTHSPLNNMLCRWDDPSVYSDDNGATWKSRSGINAFVGDPGQDYQCRCFASPNFNDILKE